LRRLAGPFGAALRLAPRLDAPTVARVPPMVALDGEVIEGKAFNDWRWLRLILYASFDRTMGEVLLPKPPLPKRSHMTDQEWAAYLDTLSPEQRIFAQLLREMMSTLLDRERSRWIDERQALEREIARLRVRVDVLHQTIDDLFGRHEQARGQ